MQVVLKKLKVANFYLKANNLNLLIINYIQIIIARNVIFFEQSFKMKMKERKHLLVIQREYVLD